MPHHKHLAALFSVIDEGYCLCEMIFDSEGRALDYRFLEVNHLFEEMTGLADARGRTARELVPQLEQFWIDTYAGVAAGETLRFQSGSASMGRVFDVFATPVPPEGRFALVFRDITAQRRAEAEHAEARARAERLLTELNHRVMNTLAMISSIVRLERNQLAVDDPAVGTIDRLQARLSASSELFRALNSTAEEDHVRTRPYLSRVVEMLAETMVAGRRIALSAQIDDIALPTAQAAPLGLLANELVTNALKYAFPGGRRGHVTVALEALQGDQIRLSVSDDGVGTAAAGNARGPGSGIGGMLIASFAEQIGGEIERVSSAAGTRVAVTFPRAATAEPR